MIKSANRYMGRALVLSAHPIPPKDQFSYACNKTSVQYLGNTANRTCMHGIISQLHMLLLQNNSGSFRLADC